MILPQATVFMEIYTSHAYQQFVRNCLSRQDQRMCFVLTEICCRQPNFPAARLNIEIAPLGILNGLPINLFYSDDRGRVLPESVLSLGKAFGIILTPTEMEAVYRFDEIGVETIEIELQILLEWLIARWQSILKPEKSFPVYLGIQDDREVLDLLEMRWIVNPRHGISA